MSVVLDASVTLSWAFSDETTADLDRILERVAEEGALVPPLWRYEVANGMLTAFRRGRMSASLRSRFLDLVEQLPIEVVAGAQRPEDLVRVGQQYQLSAYDAAYLELALDRGADLATVDQALAAAGRDAGLAVLPSHASGRQAL